MRPGKTRRDSARNVNNMTSMSFPKTKNTEAEGLGPNYNFQHLVFTTKYRNQVFDNGNIIEIATEAFYHAAAVHHIEIKVLSFGEDYAHVHMEVNVPSTRYLPKIENWHIEKLLGKPIEHARKIRDVIRGKVNRFVMMK